MREKVKDKGCLEHILQAIKDIRKYQENIHIIENDIPDLKPCIERYLEAFDEE